MWWRPEKAGGYRPVEPGDVEQLRKEFESRGRAAVLDAV